MTREVQFKFDVGDRVIINVEGTTISELCDACGGTARVDATVVTKTGPQIFTRVKCPKCHLGFVSVKRKGTRFGVVEGLNFYIDEGMDNLMYIIEEDGGAGYSIAEDKLSCLGPEDKDND
jgi:hypothetical protein